jgi:hypothetical protein
MGSKRKAQRNQQRALLAMPYGSRRVTWKDFANEHVFGRLVIAKIKTPDQLFWPAVPLEWRRHVAEAAKCVINLPPNAPITACFDVFLNEYNRWHAHHFPEMFLKALDAGQFDTLADDTTADAEKLARHIKDL